MKRSPRWAFFSLVINGLFILLLSYIWWGDEESKLLSVARSDLSIEKDSSPKTSSGGELGEKQKLTYQQWVDLLKQEAKVAAEKQPENLTVLLGDSISLWFPPELLPEKRYWLNQGISGEGSAGLLRRLKLIDKTNPQGIFIMIGINDLIRGVEGETVVANVELIVEYLRRNHPESTIILQSILPHSGSQSTWEGRERLLELPNRDIRDINRRLEKIAEQEEIIYLDLYSLFADDQGNLNTELTTDGLHLNPKGYELWRIALQVSSQLEIGETGSREQGVGSRE
ncbi:MAG: GDSL-type esterase/lipase family protein [Spirulinaceae cyanobacterium]